jgi:hypothetical protein
VVFNCHLKLSNNSYLKAHNRFFLRAMFAVVLLFDATYMKFAINKMSINTIETDVDGYPL